MSVGPAELLFDTRESEVKDLGLMSVGPAALLFDT